MDEAQALQPTVLRAVTSNCGSSSSPNSGHNQQAFSREITLEELHRNTGAGGDGGLVWMSIGGNPDCTHLMSHVFSCYHVYGLDVTPNLMFRVRVYD